ncbi:c-type cytochrome [bacterium]|nr:c-type cytochrome [bacterium]
MPSPRSLSLPLMLIPLLPLTVWCQGYPANEAASKMSSPNDIRVTLVASEPMVRQPVAIDFDDQGRLWVMQYLQYPNPEGLRRTAVDRYSRTKYDKQPEPPPRGPHGSDKLTILIDANKDGVIDRSVDFIDGLNLASGFVHGRGGVFVAQAPYLLFYPDANNDDRPDSDPKVLLTGFGMEDAHSVVNSLTWGPDGWLYGLQGSTCTAKIRGIEFQQGVWRYHVEKDRFELFAEGGGNMWGLDFDPVGQLITSTNLGGFTSMHAVQGGYYWKSFGKHGPLHNPYTFGYFDHIPCKQFEGGHVSVGGTLYFGSSLPTSYRGQYLFGNLLSHGVYQQKMERSGSTFRGGPTQEWIRSNDTWFASSDLCVGPDGAVYVTDWHDSRTAHPDPDATWDRSNGRIFRVAGKVEQATPFNNGSIVDRLFDDDAWTSRRALRQLADSHNVKVEAALVAMLDHAEETRGLRSMWALYQLGFMTDDRAVRMLDHASENIRAWVIRFAGDDPPLFPKVISHLPTLAAQDASPRVQSQLASTARRLPWDESLAILKGLIGRSAGIDDPHVPFLVWWGVEKLASDNLVRTIDALAEIEWNKQPLWTDVVLPRLAKRAAADVRPEGWLAYETLLKRSDPSQLASLMKSFSEAFDLRPAVGPSADQMLSRFAETSSIGAPATRTSIPPIPESLRALLAKLWREHPDDVDYLRSAIGAKIDEARQRAMDQAKDPQRAVPDRIMRIDLLSRYATNDLWELGQQLTRSTEPIEIRLAGLRVLSKLDEPRVADLLLGIHEQGDPTLRTEVRRLLVSRPTWGLRLIEQVAAGKLDPTALAIDEVRALASLPGDDIKKGVTKFWGTVRAGTPEEKLAEVRRLNNDLRAGAGDPVAGQQVFSKHCATCHQLFGEGSKVGPDLTHANRTDKEYLLVSLVDPSLTVRKEYVSFICETVDGRVLTGVITQQEGESITLVDSTARATTMARGQISDLQESATSVMPEDLYRKLSPIELRDLFAYVMLPMSPTTSLPQKVRDAQTR